MVYDSVMTSANDALSAFIEAASVPRDGGTLDRARAILSEHHEVATANICATAVLGDDDGVRRFVVRDAATATATGGPCGWDARATRP